MGRYDIMSEPEAQPTLFSATPPPKQVSHPEKPNNIKLTFAPVDIEAADPRPDKKADTLLWKRLLENARQIAIMENDKEFYGVIHGIRCGGATVIQTGSVKRGDNSFRFLRGDWSEAEWEEIREKWLTPIKEQILRLFTMSSMGQIVPDPHPDDSKRLWKEDKPNADKTW